MRCFATGLSGSPNPHELTTQLLTRSPRRHGRTRAASCVDGPRLARDFLTRRTVIACSHVSGLLMQPKPTAGPDGFRELRPHHSNGINVPPKRQASLSCVGPTDCAITRHCSLASSSTRLSSSSCQRRALVILLPVHHRPGDARRLVRKRYCYDHTRPPPAQSDHPWIGIGRLRA